LYIIILLAGLFSFSSSFFIFLFFIYSKQTQEEIKRLQKELLANKKEEIVKEELKKEIELAKKEQVEVVKNYKDEVERYEHLKKKSKNTKEDKVGFLFL
jgi:predicted Holliday junction resolvase-like endonuclease